MKFTYLVVDDERLSRDYVIDLLNEFEDRPIIHEAASLQMALALIDSEKPDVLFLDINMPAGSGFDVLESTYYRNFEVVFITAYSEFAIKAIKAGAADYLLKPLNKAEFKLCLEKVVQRRQNVVELQLRRNMDLPDPYLEKTLQINQQNRSFQIAYVDIIYMEADNTYTTFFLANGRKLVASKPIIYFEKELGSKWFFRIHKSHIINLYHYRGHAGGNLKHVMMSDGATLLISRYRWAEFETKLEKLKPGSIRTM